MFTPYDPSCYGFFGGIYCLRNAGVVEIVIIGGARGRISSSAQRRFGSALLFQPQTLRIIFCHFQFFQGETFYAHPPLPFLAPFLARRHFSGQEREVVYFEPPPPQQKICMPPLFCTPAPPRRVFSGVGGCIKLGPPNFTFEPGSESKVTEVLTKET